jgi:hypothetical protein
MILCNIWVILRRNVIYFYSKNLILINFFTDKVTEKTQLYNSSNGITY